MTDPQNPTGQPAPRSSVNRACSQAAASARLTHPNAGAWIEALLRCDYGVLNHLPMHEFVDTALGLAAALSAGSVNAADLDRIAESFGLLNLR